MKKNKEKKRCCRIFKPIFLGILVGLIIYLWKRTVVADHNAEITIIDEDEQELNEFDNYY